MALNNIISPKQQQLNSQGAPLAGGFVFLYEPGTTTFISSFTSSDLVTPHTNPVRLSGSGRADIWITRDCDIVVTDRLGNGIYTQDNANPDALGGEESGGLVANGSFEIETTPPVPDSWTPVNEAGSTNAVDSAESTDGANSYRFTSSGVGGGSLTTTDFFPVNDVDNLRVNFDLFSTLATVLNIVRVEWYDVTFVSISNTDVYSSTANPLAWTEFQLVATPPANARFAKLRLIGIDPSVPLAGSTYFDRINVFYPQVVSGIFDNITIQNNEIISTNLNGEISMKPNGTGAFIVERNGVLAFATGDSLLAAYSPSNGNPVTPDAIAVNLDLLSQDGNTYASLQIGAGDPGDLALTNFANGGSLALQVEGGTDGLFVDALGVTLRDTANDENRMSTVLTTDPDTVFGISVVGQLGNNPATGGDQDQVIEFANNSNQRSALIGFFDEDDGFQMGNHVIDGSVNVYGNTTLGGFINGLVFDVPGGRVDLYAHSGASPFVAARTALPSAGGLTANNTLTGAGFERVLTESDAAGSQFIRQVADDTVNNTTTLVDTELVLSNIPTGEYRLDMKVLARDVAVSNCGMRVTVATVGVASQSVMSAQVDTFSGVNAPVTPLIGGINQTFQFPSLDTGSGTSRIQFWGTFRVTSGTNSLTVRFAQNTAQVGDLDFEANSMLAVTRLGA